MDTSPVFKPRERYCEKGITVKEIAYYEDQNEESRPYMEDGCVIADNLINDGDFRLGVFAILDGHGGSDVRDHLRELIPKVFKDLFSEKGNRGVHMKETITKGFLTINEIIKKRDLDAGACASVCFVFEEAANRQKRVLMANVGDSRCVAVYEGDKVRRLTKDHKATDPAEIRRVEKEGGKVYKKRVEGRLAITRAFGDTELEDCGVTAEPFITEYPITPQSEYIIMATDGLWDVISDQDISDHTKKLKKPYLISQGLVKEAMKLGTKDNTSVLTLKVQINTFRRQCDSSSRRQRTY
eukprot:TRINITY_DN10083_c0_g1_i3.p2 TRINITY_DN10083_c0_g1~~TRINITY_DN10083_c0_g1_i3.p2  ORF type:complete len:297 (-),score=35.33 TRINITY_DN10083_c0_g1_i3:214-1104(-)